MSGQITEAVVLRFLNADPVPGAREVAPDTNDGHGGGTSVDAATRPDAPTSAQVGAHADGAAGAGQAEKTAKN
ncbi:MAG: hypothetical protein H7X95_07280 [Deltaproteobacteria bacterium]|nr:hypothetical protein [Deltaproteobacteria bacterium]